MDRDGGKRSGQLVQRKRAVSLRLSNIIILGDEAMKAFLSVLDAIFNPVERVERVLCAILVAAFCILLTLNVGMRYLFNAPIYFAEELCIILMTWMALIACSLSIGSRTLIAVTLIPDMLPPKTKHRLAVVSHILVTLISAIFLYWSMNWLLSPRAQVDIIQTLEVVKWPSFTVVPIFFALATLKSFRNVVYLIVVPDAIGGPADAEGQLS